MNGHSDPDLHSQIGQAYDKLRKYDLASHEFANAARDNPSFWFYRTELCHSKYMMGMYSEALADCTEASRLDSSRKETYDQRREVYAAIAKKVLDCYKAGQATVRDMHACAGVWVTARILTLCFLDADCPAIPDSINARAVIEAALGGPGNLDTKISIDLGNVLSFPNRIDVAGCQGAGTDSATQCVVDQPPETGPGQMLVHGRLLG